MKEASKQHILVVDDEKGVRDSFSLMLSRLGGYQVTTAENGFDALLKLKHAIPELIISDLNMPQMSGFEFLSVVRRRFPQVPVIAISGAYGSVDQVPGGVIADAFHAKGSNRPQALLDIVAELIRTSEEHAVSHKRKSAPVWIPRNGKDSNGVPFIVLSCTDCLRSFPMSVLREEIQEIQETPCLFCSNLVRYVIDFSVGVCSPKLKKELSDPASA